MKKLLTITATLIAALSATAQSITTANLQSQSDIDLATDARSIYSFKVEALDGSIIDLSKYRGKKILIVNTASKCGYTPQYEGLQKLYDKYKDRLVIIGFPANNFGGQEPGTNVEIKEFCTKNYGVSFPMAAKVSVKGDDIAPIYKWLCNMTENGVMDAEIKWNFGKFLLDEKGNLISDFPSKVAPLSAEITGKL